MFVFMWLAVEFFILTEHSHFHSNHAKKIKQFKIYMMRYCRVVAGEMGGGARNERGGMT